MSVTKEMLGCPFCGEKPVVEAVDDSWWNISCEGSACKFNPWAESFNLEELISIWNERKS